MVSLGLSDFKLLLYVECLVGDCVYIHQDYMLWCQCQELFQYKATAEPVQEFPLQRFSQP